ncbi:ABC transporter substrate-binding protein [Nocardioides mangrovicus]|uniref:ABC transporter substrate-binding protein n=1 Tax=Nocardioides mangrovicus TaxID=2478913 RepID=A0A3L8P7N0_9ACTN|nr:ABC transporter substrate-binding protein [Nocardioides mangrovicus]RLV50957.1 ABC transporter substrate-binding protein [Nocardioides mangrovicus]
MTDHQPLLATDRRSLLKLGGLGALGVGAAPLLSACGIKSSSGASGSDTVRIGYVSPQTGSLAPFGEADAFVVSQVKKIFAQKGLKIGGKKAKVEILVRDSQSDSKRAGDVASDLILKSNVDLMLVSSTPDNTNPVSDQCEANGVPCISTVAPWQPWFLGRGGTTSKSFEWTYHFFWGLEDVESVYMDMWGQVDSNQKVGAIWPNDSDGNAWGDAKTGFPPVVAKKGFSIIDPGHYADGTTDFTAQISRFKSGNAELLAGVPIPPDFITFWKQAVQQQYQPKLATIGKALLFPSTISALGDTGNNLGTEVWWSPSHPFTSSLSGQSAKQLADAYTASTSKQWTQPIGFVHALFEVASAALAKASSPSDKKGIVKALSTMRLSTVVGDLDWTSGPVPNVAKTPLVGGQWRGDSKGYDLVIVSNADHPNIPAGGKVQPL